MAEAFPSADLPDLTADQMREVDRVMVDELGVSLVQMMENAGRGLAELAVARYAPASCAVLAGPGGNGGGGLVAGRHLHNRGVAVNVTLAVPERMAPVPARQLAILEAIGVPVTDDPAPADPCVSADATLTLALPKVGLRRAGPVVGALYAADVSVPPTVYERMGLAVGVPFAAGPIVRVG